MRPDMLSYLIQFQIHLKERIILHVVFASSHRRCSFKYLCMLSKKVSKYV